MRSHLLPRAFAHDVRAGEPKLLIGSLHQKGERFSQSGIVDTELLCARHEQMLGPLDTYAVEFVRTFEENKQSGPDSFTMTSIDGDKLARFAISVLWRFGASKCPEADPVKLGVYETRFRDLIFEKQDCSKEPLVTLWALRSRKIKNIKQLCTIPSSVRGTFFRYWSFVICGLAFAVKTDQRATPDDLNVTRLNGRDSLIGVYRDFDETDTWNAVVNIVSNMKAHRNAGSKS